MCTYTRCNFCDCLQFGPILACLVFENKDVHADLLNAHVQIHPESNGLLGLLTKTFHGQTFSLPVPIRMTFGLLHSASSKKKVYESQWDWATAAALYRAMLLQIWASLQWSMCANSLSPINPLHEHCMTPIVWVHAQAIYFLYCYSSGWILLIV